jgi:hypothetical protein
MPSRVPCDAGLNRDIACRHPAWTAGWFSHPVSPGFHPGLFGTRVAPQKAPGGSRGTPGRISSRVPCDVGLNRDIACRHPAWTAGWFSHPVSPGFHPGLLGTRVASTKSPRRKPGDSGSHAFPDAMLRGFEPGHCVPSSSMDGGVVFTPGVPGFPPGAFWNACRSTKSPRREPGDSGSHAFPGAMRCGFEPGNCVPSSSMDGGVVFTPGVPGFPPGAFWNARRFHKKPPAGAGGLRVAYLPGCHAARV